MNSTVRTILFWLLMILLAVVLWRMASTGGQSAHEDEPNYTNFLAKVQNSGVKDVRSTSRRIAPNCKANIAKAENSAA